MKNNRRNFFLPLLGRFFSASAIVISFFGVSHAAQQSWKTDAATTAWATGTNWVSGTAPTSSITADTALFNQTAYLSQPNAGTTSITGITIGDGTTATAPLTLSGTQLTLGASGIDQKAAAGATSITSPLTIGAAQTWAVGGSSTLTTSGAITGAALTLTTTGTGTLNFAGAYTGTGAIRFISAAGTTSNVGVQTGATISAANIQLYQDNIVNGAANYTQTGGTVSATADFMLGASSAGGASGRTNSATISGGSVTTPLLALYKWAASDLKVSNSGVVNATSVRIGWVDSAPTGSITLGDGVTFSGGTSINDGGTSGLLNVNGWNIQNNRNYALNFKGGTLKANAASATWLPAGAFASATVQDAGGIIDNGGFAITIGQALNHGGTASTDGGLVFKGTGSTVLSAAGSYNGPTTVKGGSVTIPETSVTSGIALANGTTLNVSGNTGAILGAAAPLASVTLGSTPGAGGATLTFNNFVSNNSQQLLDTTNFSTSGAAQGVTINVVGTFSGVDNYPLVSFGNPTIGGNGIGALKLGTLPRGVTGNLYEDSQILWLGVTGFNPLKWKGNVAGGIWDINSTANWQGVDTKYQDGDVVILDNTATGTTNVSLNTAVSPASVTAADSNYTIAGTGSINGTGGVTKNGTGALTLGTNNGYAGLTSVKSGTIKAGHANAFGSTATGTEVTSGAVLDLNGAALAAEPILLNGTGISSSGALVNNSAVTASAAAPITLGSAGVSIGGSGNMTLSGDIAGTTGLTKAGAGMTTFSSKKSYTGDTVVSAGTLELSGGGGAGGTIRGAVTVNTGATLRISAGDATGYDLAQPRLTAINLAGSTMNVATASNQTLGAAALTLTGATITGVSGSNLDFFTSDNAQTPRSSFTTLASANPSVVSGTTIKMRQNDGVVFDIADGAAPIDLDIQSNLRSDALTNNQLVKNGPGTMRLSGLSTYAVPTFVNEGKLIIPVAQSSPAFTVADTAALSLLGAPGTSFSVSDLTLGSSGATTFGISNFGGQALAANAPVKVSNSLITGGTATLNVTGSFPAAGTYPLISYPASYFNGTTPFNLVLPPNVTGTLQDNPTNLSLDLVVSAVNPLTWKGSVAGGAWDINNTANWFTSASAPAGKYQENMVVLLDDTATGTTSVALNTVVSPSGVAVNNSTKNYAISGTGGIGGTAALTKTGTGTLTLATANTTTGQTTISGGTLQLGDGTANGSVGGNIVNNANLAINTVGSQTLPGVISGTGPLAKSGSGALALTGSPTYTGATTISAGTLQVPSLTATSSITNNGNLVFKRSDGAENNPAGVITGTGNVSYSGPDVAASLIGYYRLDDANTYGGTTTISNCRAAVTNSTACGTGPIVVTSGGQFWPWINFGQVFNNPITLNGIGWNEGGFLGAIRLNKAAVLTGPITLASDSRISVNNSGATDGGGTISGVISGPGGLEVTGNQNNVLVLTGSSSNTYAGATRITSGQVVLNKSAGLALTGDITMDNTGSPTMWQTSATQLSPTALLSFTGNSGNARFHLMGTTQTFRGIVNNSTAATAVIQNSEAVGAAPNASPLDYGTSNLVLNPQAGDDFSFLNVHLRNGTGVLNLVKNGAGRQTVGGSTTVDYSGTTSINAGELRFYDMDDTQSRAITIASGATLKVEALTTRNFNGNIFAGGTWSGTGSVIMTGAGIKQFNGNAATNISLGSGALVDVQQGVLRLGFGGLINTSGNRADLNVASGATFNNWDSSNTYFDALTGTGTVTRGYTPDTGVTSTGIGNFVVGVDNGSATFGGVISDQVGNVGSILNLVKRGAGTQTLAGINDYDGTTRVEGGTLALSGAGDISNSSGITVLPGAVLDVSSKTTTFTQATGKSLTAGRTGAPANDIVGNYASGGSIDVAGTDTAGTVTFNGNLSLTGGGSLTTNVSPSVAANNDKVAVTGNLSLTGTTTVNPVISGIPDTTNPYVLMTYSGILTGNASNLASGLTNSRYAATFSTATANQVQMSLTGIGKNLTWMGNTNTTWSAPSVLPDAPSLNWVDDSTVADNFQNLDAVTFGDTASTGAGAGAVSVDIPGNVSPAVMTVNNPTRAYTFNGVGTIAGGGKLTKAGAASLTIGTAGTFGGGTAINEGTISLGLAGSIEENVTSLGSGAIAINTGATLKLDPKTTGSTYTFPNAVSLNGGTLWGNDGTQRFSTLLTLGSGGTNTIKATWNNKPIYLDGGIGGAGNLLVTGQTGGNGGIVRLTTPNTYAGTITVDNTGGGIATLFADHNAALGTAAVVLGNSGSLGLGGLADNVTVRSLSSTNASAKVYNADATFRTLTHTGTADENITGTLGDGTANGVRFSLVKANAGTLTLSNANTFAGQTRVLAGTLALTNASALAGSTLVYNNEGGSVDFTGLTALTVGNLKGAQNFTLPSSVTALTIGNASNTDDVTYTGAISVPGAAATFTKKGLGNLTLGGSVSNSWAGNTTIDSTGGPGNSSQATLYLAKTGGALAIPANTTVNFGTSTTGQANLRTLVNNQFGANVVMNFGNASGNWCRFDLLGTTQTLAGVTGTAGGIIQNTGIGNYTGPDPSAAATLVLTGSGTYTYTGGYIRDNDSGANPLRRINIRKTGSGTQTFTDTISASMTGFTVVDAGTLVIKRTAAGDDYYSSTAYSVAANAVLQFDTAANGRLSSQTGDVTGNGTVRKTGVGTTNWANSGSNTQLFLDFGTSGLVDVQGGNLASLSTRATNKADVLIAGGATLSLNNGGISASTSYFDGLNGGSSSSNATLDLGRNIVLGVNGDGGTFFGNITGAGGITKEGAATLTLTGANGVSPAPVVPTSASTFSGDITVNGGKLIGGATGSVFGTASNTRTITVNAGTTMEFQAPNAFGNHGGGNTPTLVINGGTVTNSDPLASNKVNNGLRNVTLNNGVLTATAGNGSSDIDATNRPNEGYGAWGLNGTVTSSGISTISTSATGKARNVLLNSGAADTVMSVTDGTLTVSAPLQGGDGDVAGLNKTGAGRLVLSEVNIYRGPTTVSAGTLELNGSLVKADGAAMTPSNITVAPGATLKGTGSAAGTLAANGIVAPGNSVGTLAVGTTSFGATGSLAAEIDSNTATGDKLAITGDLNIDPAATLTVTDLGSGSVPGGVKIVLATYSGVWNSTPFAGRADDSSLTVGSTPFTLNYNDTVGGVSAVTLTSTGTADPFSTWASSFGLTGPDSAKGADPDKDGVKNILEFASASSPTNGSSGPRVYPLMFAIGADNALTLTAAVRTGAVFAASGTKQTATRDQVYYTFEATNELGNWTTVPVTEVTGTTATNIRTALGAKLTVPALGADWEWHTFRTDQGAQVDPSDFIRLRVSDAP